MRLRASRASARGRVRLRRSPGGAPSLRVGGDGNPLRPCWRNLRPGPTGSAGLGAAGVVTVSGVLEGVLREDLPLPGLLGGVVGRLAPLLLRRRTHPLAVVAPFGVTAVVDIGLIASDAPALDMYTMVYSCCCPTHSSGGVPAERPVAGLAIILVPATMSFFVMLDRGGRRDRRGRGPDVRLCPGLGRAVPSTAPGSGGWSR